jgi:aminoglycoside phosphotransferase (APT) family kinase protein
VFIHGDYKSDHLLVGRNRLTVIDLDRCAAGDPALDLGKFLADLRWWLGAQGTDAVATAQQMFLSGYGPAPSTRLARARALEPLALLKIAARRVQQHEPDWEGRTGTLVGTVADLVEGLERV